jgi:hypothetical protein
MINSQKEIKIEIVNDLNLYFKDLLEASAKHKYFRFKKDTETYVLGLLTRTNMPINQNQSLVLTYLEAITADKLNEPQEKNKKQLFKDLGDTCLFYSGYFADHIRKKDVSKDLYIMLGSNSYSIVANLTLNQLLYNDLARNFASIREILEEVHDRTDTHTNEGLMRLYDKWLEGNESIADLLKTANMVKIKKSNSSC